MTDAPNPAEESKPQPRVGVSSFREKTEHKWHAAEPASPERKDRAGATVYTPEEEHNRSGPESERHPDPALVPSLMVLAATLGIKLIDGERLIDGIAPSQVQDNSSDQTAPLGEFNDYDSPVHVGADVLTDPDASD